MNKPNRRQLIGTICSGTLVSMMGCINDSGGADPTGDGDSTANSNGSSDDATEFPRSVRVTEYDDFPADVSLEVSMEVEGGSISADGTAYLIKEIESTYDHPLEFQRMFYKGSSREAGDPGILVYSLDAADTPTEGEAVHCIEGADPDQARDSSAMTEEAPPFDHVDPGERIVIEYIISDDWDHEECFPVGEYRFEGGGIVTVNGKNDEPMSFDWGFTLELS